MEERQRLSMQKNSHMPHWYHQQPNPDHFFHRHCPLQEQKKKKKDNTTRYKTGQTEYLINVNSFLFCIVVLEGAFLLYAFYSQRQGLVSYFDIYLCRLEKWNLNYAVIQQWKRSFSNLHITYKFDMNIKVTCRSSVSAAKIHENNRIWKCNHTACVNSSQ